MGYYPYYPKIEKATATEVTIDGKQKIMLGSNNYLGLTNHPKVIEAGVKALREYGSGLTGSRLLNGNTLLHDQLEEQLADFVHMESTLVFSTGFGTNLGTISTICGPDDLIFSDEYNHASIVDGIRFSGARKCKYKHNDMQDLEEKLAFTDPGYPRFIVTDGIFSMEGDIARLDELAALSKKYPSRLMVDDAHSLGILGPRGDGTAAHFNVTKELDLIMGTFSKSLGFDIGESVTPIIPIIIGKDLKTFQVWKDLMGAGVYTNPIVSPAVPRGRGLLRSSCMATHTRRQLEFCLDMFEKIGRKARIIR